MCTYAYICNRGMYLWSQPSLVTASPVFIFHPYRRSRRPSPHARAVYIYIYIYIYTYTYTCIYICIYVSVSMPICNRYVYRCSGYSLGHNVAHFNHIPHCTGVFDDLSRMPAHVLSSLTEHF